MNRTAAAGVLFLHGLGLAVVLLGRAAQPPTQAGEARLAVRLLEARPPVVRAPVTLPVPSLPQLRAPVLVPTPNFVEVAPVPAPAQLVAAAPPATARPTPATAHAEAPPPAEDSRLQAVALPPEHGACSARGIERHYPALLRERGIEGLVLLRVQVDPQGRAADVIVQSGSGWRLLDEAARQVALACPYLPAQRGDQRLTAWVEYPLRFALHRAAQ